VQGFLVFTHYKNIASQNDIMPTLFLSLTSTFGGGIVRQRSKETIREVSMTATVTAKGQVTLPVEVRRRLGLRPGSKLEFIVIDDDRLEAIPVSETVSSLKGMVPKPRKALSLTGMDKAIAKGAL
jgi:antitoxin PrlF